MATKQRTIIKTLPRKRDEDEARFEAWLSDFDARMADLTARQDSLLRKLGLDPVRSPAVPENA